MVPCPHRISVGAGDEVDRHREVFNGVPREVHGFKALQSEVYYSAQKVLVDIEHPESRYYTGVPIVLRSLARFSTSTWIYEGWPRQAYHKDYPRGTFARDCLVEYCQFLYKGYPLFLTIGNDAAFYRPLTPGQLTTFVAQSPVISKGWSCNGHVDTDDRIQ